MGPLIIGHGEQVRVGREAHESPGVEPEFDGRFYVGVNVAGYELALNPSLGFGC